MRLLNSVVILWSLILSSKAYCIDTLDSLEGIIRVLKAPIYHLNIDPSLQKNKILEYKSKGDRILLHKGVTLKQQFKKNEMIEVLTSQGRIGYTPHEFVEVLYLNKRELTTKPTLNHDPTDYRLEEPLDKNYPFQPQKFYRGQYRFALSQAANTLLPSSGVVQNSQTNLEKFLEIQWLKERPVDLEQKFYFGLSLQTSFHQKIYLINNQFLEQQYWNLSLGPYINFDYFQHKNYDLVFMGGIRYHLVDQYTAYYEEDKETKIFLTHQGFSFETGLQIQHDSFFNGFKFGWDIILKTHLPRVYQDTNDNQTFSQSAIQQVIFGVSLIDRDFR